MNPKITHTLWFSSPNQYLLTTSSLAPWLFSFLMSEFSTLVQEYYKNPVNNHHMQDAMIFRHEGNAVCWDDITVYMKYSLPEGVAMAGESLPTASSAVPYLQSTVTERSYDWNVSMVTQAAASFFSELIIWKTFEEILTMTEQLMIDNWFEVSTRRRRARVIALVATRNAIHQLLKDGKEDSFDDVLLEQ